MYGYFSILRIQNTLLFPLTKPGAHGFARSSANRARSLWVIRSLICFPSATSIPDGSDHLTLCLRFNRYVALTRLGRSDHENKIEELSIMQFVVRCFNFLLRNVTELTISDSAVLRGPVCGIA
jgi:hypothetical protein